MRIELLPSLMCADFARLGEEIEHLEAAGADGFHIDVMDGLFVPNYAMGLGDIQAARRVTKKPLDAHLMAERPADAVDRLADAGVDALTVHVEADRQIARTLERIRSRGLRAGVALNPGTPAESVREALSLADIVLVMTVNPGFAGQKYLLFVEDKLRALHALQPRYGFALEVDGAISPERVASLPRLGVSRFVLGTAGLFGHGPYGEAMAALRALSDARA